MKSIVKKFMALLICIFTLASFGDVMLWTVDGDATVDGTSSVYAFLSPVPDDDLHNPAARVKITGAGLSEPIYLDNYWREEGSDHAELDVGGGYYGVPVGDPGSGRYSAYLQQSHVPAELAMEALFSIELGRMDWDDDTWMSGAFQVLAESDKYTYEQVRAHMYPAFDLYPSVPEWNPTYYHTVSPEPNSGILLLIGIGFLGLKRKSA